MILQFKITALHRGAFSCHAPSVTGDASEDKEDEVDDSKVYVSAIVSI